MISISEDQEMLEQKADEARQRLLDKVDLLEQRKEAVVTTARRVEHLLGPVAIGAAVAGVFLSATVVSAVVRAKQRKARTKAWSLPAKALFARAQPRKPPSFAGRLTRELALMGLTTVGGRLLEWAIDRAMPRTSRPLPTTSFAE
jgi:hypothetical protein